MRRDVLDLRAFYASALGRTVREAVGRHLAQAWGDAAGLDVLLWGYATPFAAALAGARRTVAAMPAMQGVEAWPASGRNLASLAPEDALPFPAALFDRVLAAHLLEESEAPGAALAEAARVLRPSGRLVIVAAARAGVWSRAESTPFGHGRPYSRGQLEREVRGAGLEPVAWSRTLYVPPLALLAPAAGVWEEGGRRLGPALGGLVLLEATRRSLAVRAPPAAARVRARARPVLAPAPVPANLAARTPSAIDGSQPGRTGSRRSPP